MLKRVPFQSVVHYLLNSLYLFRVYPLRTTITVLIIIFGLTAITGILTAIEAIRYSLFFNFSQMGANTLIIKNHEFGSEDDLKLYPPITWQQASEFVRNFDFPAHVSIHAPITGMAEVKFENKKTNPNVTVIAIDHVYMNNAGYHIRFGRNMTEDEVFHGNRVAVVGFDVSEKLFDRPQNAIHKKIYLLQQHFDVIGVLEQKGSTFGFSGDNNVFIPLSAGRAISSNTMNFAISIQPFDPKNIQLCKDEAIRLMRTIRKDLPGKASSFEVQASNILAETLYNNIQYIAIASVIIGFITLFGSAIGLMNIMLVNVADRIKEIGIRKALGASSFNIQMQFLSESVVISIIGGMAGTIIGVLVGNLMSSLLQISFIIPLKWIFLGFVLCVLVGILAGWLPARKAALLHPIESLRYE